MSDNIRERFYAQGGRVEVPVPFDPTGTRMLQSIAVTQDSVMEELQAAINLACLTQWRQRIVMGMHSETELHIAPTTAAPESFEVDGIEYHDPRFWNSASYWNAQPMFGIERNSYADEHGGRSGRGLVWSQVMRREGPHKEAGWRTESDRILSAIDQATEAA